MRVFRLALAVLCLVLGGAMFVSPAVVHGDSNNAPVPLGGSIQAGPTSLAASAGGAHLRTYPAGTVAVCNDYSPTSSSDATSACSAHGGVLDWFVAPPSAGPSAVTPAAAGLLDSGGTPTVDASAPTVDASTPTVDAGAPTVDASAPIADPTSFQASNTGVSGYDGSCGCPVVYQAPDCGCDGWYQPAPPCQCQPAPPCRCQPVPPCQCQPAPPCTCVHCPGASGNPTGPLNVQLTLPSGCPCPGGITKLLAVVYDINGLAVQGAVVTGKVSYQSSSNSLTFPNADVNGNSVMSYNAGDVRGGYWVKYEVTAAIPPGSAINGIPPGTTATDTTSCWATY